MSGTVVYLRGPGIELAIAAKRMAHLRVPIMAPAITDSGWGEAARPAAQFGDRSRPTTAGRVLAMHLYAATHRSALS
jgi:hypothetical protein